MTARARLLALGALVPALAGCGGSGGGGADSMPDAVSEHTATAGPPADTRRADPASVATIRGWVNAERLVKLDAAASFFSLPVIVLNGPEPLLLRTRTAVRQWNESLPCGAALLRAVDVRGWTVARFRLTDRSGGHCDGPGAPRARPSRCARARSPCGSGSATTSLPNGRRLRAAPTASS